MFGKFAAIGRNGLALYRDWPVRLWGSDTMLLAKRDQYCYSDKRERPHCARSRLPDGMKRGGHISESSATRWYLKLQKASNRGVAAGDRRYTGVARACCRATAVRLLRTPKLILIPYFGLSVKLGTVTIGCSKTERN